MIFVQHTVLDLYFYDTPLNAVVFLYLSFYITNKVDRFVSYEPSPLGATTVVYCAVNRTQPYDVILNKTVTSCCHDLSGTKTTDIFK